MDFDAVINKRRSVRSFKSRLPSWKDILEAIDTANKSPFAGNINNLKFIIIENDVIIREISKFAQQTWINEAGVLLIVCSDDIHLENLYGERGRVYSKQQAGAAIITLLLKLTDLGLASCWVGAYNDELIKEKLSIPQHMQVEAIIPIGYEKGKSGPKNKKSLDATIFWEKWDNRYRPVITKEPQEKHS